MWGFEIENLRENQELIERLIEKKKLLDQHRPLPGMILEKLHENLSLEWTYNSNGIEGNTITLQETQLILQEGITVKGKSLREHFETYNHDKAIEYLYGIVGNTSLLLESDIMRLHELVLNNIEEDYRGRIRNAGVRISGANFIPPNANKVSDLFKELIDYVNLNPEGLDPISLATIFHHRFVWIHPFFDGNGRTVRLAMNLLLMRYGFPPAIILKVDRKKYYNALNNANNGNFSGLHLMMIQSLERTLNIYLNSIPGNSYDYQPIDQIVNEPQGPYSKEYVGLLARQGKIDAYKEGNYWYTSKQALEHYIQNRKRNRKLKQ